MQSPKFGVQPVASLTVDNSLPTGVLAHLPQAINFTFSLGAGDFSFLEVDFHDGKTGLYRTPRHDNLPVVSHDYPLPGRYNVTVVCFNMRNMVSATSSFYLVEPIVGASASFTPSALNIPSTPEIVVLGGTDITVHANWDDGTSSEFFVANASDIGQSNTTTFSHTYTTVGQFNVNFTFTNALGQVFVTVLVEADLEILGISLEYNQAGVVGNNAIVRNITQGSRMHCVMQYGDGQSESSYEQTVPSSVVLSHSYSDFGDYHLLYMCWNTVSNVTVEAYIEVHEAIEDMRVSIADGGLIELDGEDILVNFTFGAGYPINFMAWITTLDYTTNVSSIDYEKKEGQIYLLASFLSPGDHEFVFWYNNSLLEATFVTNITFDRSIKDANLTILGLINGIYASTRSNITIRYTQTDGSRLVYIFSYGDGQIHAYWDQELMGGVVEYSQNHQYTNASTVFVNAIVFNAFGMEELNMTLHIEHPIVGINSTISCDCTENTTSTLKFLQANYDDSPSNAVYSVDFDDGSGMLQGAFIIPDVLANSWQERYLALEHTFPRFGFYTVVLHAHNNVSTYDEVIQSIIVQRIVNCTWSISENCAKDQDCEIGIEMDYGSDLSLIIYWDYISDRDMMDFYYYHNRTLLSPRLSGHSYTSTGQFQIKAHISNNHSSCETQKDVFVDAAVTNLTAVSELVALGQTSWVNVSAAEGTRITISMYMADENGTVYLLHYDNAEDIVPVPHTYLVPDCYLVHISVCNILGCSNGTVLVEVVERMSGAWYNPPPLANTSEAAIFESNMTAGTQVICTLDYGDNTTEIIQNYPTAYDFVHVYYADGTYETTLTCTNPLGRLVFKSNITAETPIMDYLSWLDWPYILEGQALFFHNNISNGTDVSAEVTYDGVPVLNMTWDGSTLTWIMFIAEHDVGPHLINVTLYNLVSKVINVFTFTPDFLILNPHAYLYNFTRYNEPVNLTIWADAGSSVRNLVDWGDGTKTDYLFKNVENEPWALSLHHTYTTIGHHQVLVNVTNVHDTNYTFDFEVIVEHAAFDGQFILEDLDPVRVDYKFFLKQMDRPPPTNAIVDLWIEDGSNLSYPLTTTLSAVQMFTHTVPAKEIYNVTCRIYNNVSSIYVSHRLRPQRKFENLCITISEPQQPGFAHYLFINFTAGLQAKMNVSYGDGSPAEQHKILSINELPEINHTYPGIGTYYVSINLTNIYTNEKFVHLADVDTEISNCSLLYDHSHLALAEQKIMNSTETESSVSQNYTFSVPSGSRITTLYYDDSGFVYFQWLPNYTHPTIPFEVTYTTTELYNVSTYCFNSLPYQPEEAQIGVQQRIDDPIVYPVYNCVLHDEEPFRLKVNMTQGTLVYVKVNWTYNESVDFFKYGFPDGPLEVTPYWFEEPGYYNLTVTVWNAFSSKQFIIPACSEVRIAGLEATGDLYVSLPSTSPLQINIMWENGTHEEVQAFFDDNSMTHYLNYEEKTGILTIPPAFFYVGSALVTFQISNHVSLQVITAEVNMDYPIHGFTAMAVPRYIPVTTNSSIVATVRSGTRLMYEVQYPSQVANDTVADFTFSDSAYNLTAYTAQVMSTGYYEILVIVQNSVSSYNTTVQLGVEKEIDQTRLDFSHVSQYPRPSHPAQFELELPNGPKPTGVEICYDYNNSFSQCIPHDFFEFHTHQHEYNYTDYGDYFLTINVTNNISHYILTPTVRIGVAVSGLTITVDQYHLIVGLDRANFSVHVDQGSLVVYRVNYGDGNTSSPVSRSDNGWLNPDDRIISYTYETAGIFIVSVVAENLFGAITVTLQPELVLQYRIYGTEMQQLPPQPIPPGLVNFTFVNTADVHPPTNATCIFDHGDGNDLVHVPMDFIEDTFTYSYVYIPGVVEPGTYCVEVNCSNLISEVLYNMTLVLQEPINVTGSCVTEYHRYRTVVHMYFYILKGSHADITANFDYESDNSTQPGDEVVIKRRREFKPHKEQNFSYTYNLAGNYSFDLLVVNDVSSQNILCRSKFIIQIPIPLLVSTLPKYFEYGQGAWIRLEKAIFSDADPTHVSCEFFPNGTDLETISAPVLFPFTHNYRYKFGDLAIRNPHGYIVCYNMVSRQHLTFDAIVEERIANCSVTFNHASLRTKKDKLKTSVTVEQGTGVDTIFKIADDYPKKKKYKSIFAKKDDIFDMHNEFQKAMNFSVVVEVKNNINSVQCSGMDGEIIVQNDVLPIRVENTPVAAIPPGTVDFYVDVHPDYANEEPGSEPFVEFDCGPGSNNIRYAPELGQKPLRPHITTLVFSEIGPLSCNVTSFNLRSSQYTTAYTYIEEVIENLTISIHSPPFIKVNEKIDFDLELRSGSHVFFKMSYTKTGKHENEVVPHPNPFNSTRVFSRDHVFTESGNYSIRVLASNNVSNASVTSERFQGVQDVLTKLIVTTPPFVSVPGEPGSFNLSLPGNVPIQAAVHFIFEHGDGEIQKTFTAAFHNRSHYVVEHVFNESLTGHITTDIIASNMVSQISLQATNHVIRKIEGLIVNLTNFIYEVNDRVNICMEVEHGTEMHFFIDYGDNDTELVPTEWIVEKAYCFSHVFDTEGNYSVYVNASNKANTVKYVLPQNMTIQYPIVVENLKIIFYNVIPYIGNPPGYLNVSLVVIKGKVPSNVHINVRFGDEVEDQEEYSYVGMFPHSLEHRYAFDRKGPHNLSLELSNLVSQDVMDTQVNIVEPIYIEDLKCNEFAATGEVMNYTINFISGTYMNCTITYGKRSDGKDRQDNIMGLSFTFYHSYILPGTKSISIHCKNQVSEAVHYGKVKVQHPAKDLILQPQAPCVEARRQIFLRVMVQEGARVPSNTTLTVDFGDGKKDSKLETVEDGVIFFHVYYKAKTYYPKLEASNQVSMFKTNTQICVQLKIAGLRIEAKLRPNDRPRFTFPTASEIQLEAKFDEGTSVSYEWEIDDKFFNGSKITFHFTKTRLVLLTAFNYVDTDRTNTTIYINSAQQISHVAYPRSWNISKDMEFTVTLQGAPDDVCFAFQLTWLKKEKILWCGEDIDVCKTDGRFSEAQYTKVSNIVEIDYTCVFQFEEQALYKLTIYAFNSEMNVSKAEKFSISINPCAPPDIDPKDQGSCRKYRRADDVAFYASMFQVVLQCEATKEFEGRFAIPNNTRCEELREAEEDEERNVFKDISSSVGNSIVLKKNTRTYGRHCLLYQISHPHFLIQSHSHLCFELEASPLITCLNGKKSEIISFGTNHMITTKTRNCTLDVDEIDLPFSFQYFCWPWHEGMSPPDLEQMGGAVVPVPNEKPKKKELKTRKGCFSEWDAVKLDVDPKAAEFHFHSGWLTPNATYMFKVLVTKGSRTATAEYRVKVFDGEVLSIGVKCDKRTNNCHRNSMKINKDIPYCLAVWCESCKKNQLPKLDVSVKRAHKTLPVSQVTSRKIVSGEEQLYTCMDLSSLCPGRYDMEVSTRLTGAIGATTFLTAINKRPWACNYRVTPDEIKPLDRVLIKIWGCKDDGDVITDEGDAESCHEEEEEEPDRRKREVEEPNEMSLKISFYYITVVNGTKKKNPIFSSNPLLPLGDPNDDYRIKVVAEVTDLYGAQRTFSKYVTSRPFEVATEEEAEAARAEMENTINNIIDLDLTNSLDILGALADKVTALNMFIDLDSLFTVGTSRPGSEIITEKDGGLVKELAEQALLSKIINSVVQLVDEAGNGRKLNGPELLASFQAFASMVKEMTPWAELGTKEQSLDLTSYFGDNIGFGHYADNFVGDYAQSVEDIFQSTLNMIDLPALDPRKVAPAAEDRTDIALRAKESSNYEEDLLRQSAATLLDSTNKIKEVAKKGLLLEDSIMVGDSGLSVTVALSSVNNVNGKRLSTGGGEVEFPGSLISNTSGYYAVFFTMTYTREQPFGWHESAIEVDQGVTIIDIADQDGNPLEFDELLSPLKIDMPQTEAPGNWANMTFAVLDQETGMVYMYVPVDVSRSAFVVEVEDEEYDSEEPIEYLIYMNFGARDTIMDRPNTTIGTYDMVWTIPDLSRPNPFILIVPEKYISEPGVYLGILPRKPEALNPSFNVTPAFNMRSILPRCRTWDMDEEVWNGKFCQVGSDSTMGNVRCECDTLTRAVRSYSGGVSLPQVNAIDFSNVFANFSKLLAANPVVLFTLLGIVSIYILLFIWARRADKKDIEKWGVTAFLDNPPDCEHFYKVSVYTGLRQNAGTLSRACFILSGEHGDTGVRVLDDGRKRPFSRGTVRHFIMTSEVTLGELTYFRVWHDNSGEGLKASWFLDKVVVDDLQSRIRYFFLCGKWLAVDEEDGQIDRMLPPAGQEEIDGFNHVFFSTARRNLTDEHLWISVLSRPTRSYFTRAQRLTCCLLLLSSTMLANAMWYGSAESVDNDQMIKLGPIVLSLSTLLVSIYSSLTVIPINLLVVQLYRKSRPRFMIELPDGTQVMTTEGLAAVKKSSPRGTNTIKYKSDDPFAPSSKGGKANKDFETVSEAEMAIEDLEDDLEGGKETKERKGRQAAGAAPSGAGDKKKKKKRKYWFPWWGVPLAWALSALTILLSFFFVILYSLEWGRFKSEEWLSALMLAFVQSVLIIQPAKIIVIALALSIIFRKHQDDEEDENDPTNAHAAADEILEDQDEVENIDRRMKLNIPSAPSRWKLEEARKERQYEKKMWMIIQEVTTYVLFLVLVAFIAWGAKDDTRSRHTRHMRNLLEGEFKWSGVGKVKSWDKFWFYIEDTVVGIMYNVRDYRGRLTKRSERVFMKDDANVRVGFMRLRQLRIRPAHCTVPEVMGNLILECNVDYDMFDEQNGNFTFGWLSLGENYTEPKDEVEDAFRYKDVFEMKGVPLWGKVATYGGGGYVAELGASPKKSLRLIQRLKEVYWLDYYTRAIFLEYTVYNVNKNLFAHVTYLFEFPPFGGVLPRPMVRSFQIYHVLGGMGTVVLAAEGLYVIILIYFIIREIRKLRKRPWRVYFKDPWNVYEVVVIVTSLVGVVMFGALEIFGRHVTQQLRENKDAYAQYLQLSTYEESLSIVIGVIVFLTNIRFLRLLRFNRAVMDLITTARLAVRDILYFSISFLVMFVAFALSGVFLFGREVYLFSDGFRSMSGTFSIMLGKMRWYEMVHASPNLAGLYFFTFLFVMFFILIHMFISILTVAYDTARKGDALGESQNNVFEFIGGKIAGFFGCTKVRRETGAEYKDTLDTLDDRLDHINNWVNAYYRENMREKKQDKKIESGAESKDSRGSGIMKTNFSWTDMFQF